MTEPATLPRWLRLLVRCAVPAPRRADVLGDLQEAHRRRVAGAGAAAARHRLWREAAGLLAWRLGRGTPPPVSPLEPTGRSMLLRDLVQDLRFGARALARRPGFAALAVLILAVGIGAPTTVFSVVDRIFFSAPEGVADPGRLVRVFRSWGPNEGGGALRNADYLHYRENATALAGLAAYSGSAATTAWTAADGATSELDVVFTSDNFFQVLGTPLAAGRGFTPEENATPGAHPVLVVSHAFWQRALEGGDAVGTTLVLNRIPFTVVGVAPEGFKGANALADAPDAWTPIAMYGALARPSHTVWWERQPNRSMSWLQLVGRLADGSTYETAAANLANASANLRYEGRPENEGVMVVRNLALTPNAAASLRTLTTMLLGAVALVLVVALANVAVLLLAWGSTRRTELALRSALGAARGRLARQFLAESLLLGCAGALVGVGLAYLLADAAGALLPMSFAVSYRPDGSVLALAAGLALLATLAVGSAPALAATRGDLRAAIHAGRFRRGGGGLRHGLVVAQLALSLALVAGAALFTRSFQAAERQPLGYPTEYRLLVSVDLQGNGYDEARGRAFVAEALARLRALPGVASASTLHTLPFQGDWSSDVPLREGSEETWRLYLNTVSGDFFPTMGIPLLRGEGLPERPATEGPPPVVVSAALAEFLAPGGDPVGQVRAVGYDTVRVVGVAGDASFYEFGGPAVRKAWFSLGRTWVPDVTFVVHTRGEATAATPAVRGVLRELDGQLVVDGVTTVAALVDEQVARYRVSAVLVGAFGLVALLLAAVGLYGVVSFLVARRTREFGVRMALGAARGRVARGVLAGALRLALLGVGLGLVGAVWLRRFTEGLLYGVEAGDPLPLVLAALLLVAVAVAAAWLPARRATRVDPLQAMRAE